MTNLPTNPTKDELLQQHWYQFLQYLKYSPELPEDDFTRLVRDIGMENMFWSWYIQKVMAPSEATTPPDLMKQAMAALSEDGKPISHIQCNNCRYTEAFQPTDVTPEEFQKNGKETIMRMKEHFADNGWQTSWGYDLCPKCAQEHGRATSGEP